MGAPPLIPSGLAGAFPATPQDEAGSFSTGFGVGAVPGIAIGRIRHVLGSGDASAWSVGEVLIYPMVPAWPVLSRARPAAVIAERIPTDAASLAGLATLRRHGIPTVVGIADARDRFPRGGAVLVDGTDGTVDGVSVAEAIRAGGAGHPGR